MKKRISATIDSESLALLNALVKSKKYRNKSHAIESAIEVLVKKEESKKEDEEKAK